MQGADDIFYWGDAAVALSLAGSGMLYGRGYGYTRSSGFRAIPFVRVILHFALGFNAEIF